MTDFRDVAGEYAALQDALDRQPPAAGGAASDAGAGNGSSTGALQAVGWTIKLARIYTEDPRPFWLAGAGLAALVILVLVFAVRGIAR